MRLHVNEQGSGSEVCVLLHGMMGSAESWWRVAPELVKAGSPVTQRRTLGRWVHLPQTCRAGGPACGHRES